MTAGQILIHPPITMRRPSSDGRTLYYGTFVHSVSISELEICENGAIGVDSYGKIVFVEKNVESVKQVLRRYPQWAQGGKVVKAAEGSFFFPGFIGPYTILEEKAWDLDS